MLVRATHSSNIVITVQDLTFEYPGIRALDCVNFEIPAESITALVGPNGAGKTTLLRCLAALERPLAGSVHIDGIDVVEQPRACHSRVGYLSDFFGLYTRLTVRQGLYYAGAAHWVAETELATAVERAADNLSVTHLLDKPAGELSRGQRQRVAIAQAIIHAPKVVILDEPASGLDPEARASLAQLFVSLREQGMTLLISSHILAELEQYSSAMLVLRDGKLVEHSSLTAAADSKLRMRLRTVREHADIVELLKAQPSVDAIEASGHEVRFLLEDDPDTRHLLLRSLLNAGISVCDFGPEQRNLQDSYLATMRSSELEK